MGRFGAFQNFEFAEKPSFLEQKRSLHKKESQKNSFFRSRKTLFFLKLEISERAKAPYFEFFLAMPMLNSMLS